MAPISKIKVTIEFILLECPFVTTKEIALSFFIKCKHFLTVINGEPGHNFIKFILSEK